MSWFALTTESPPEHFPTPLPPSSTDIPHFDDQLYAYLHNSPYTHHYNLPLNGNLVADVIWKLNSRLCAGAPSPDFVFGSPTIPSALTKEGEQVPLPEDDEQTDMDLDVRVTLGPEYQESQRGRTCGRVFRKGEAVYRCRQCAVDETCVLCSTCFHASNHEGHETFFTLASGSAGCCDCNDPEAWKTNIMCKYHSHAYVAPDRASMPQNETPLPPPLVESIRATVSTALDFIIDTLTDSPSKLSLPVSAAHAAFSGADPPEACEMRATPASATPRYYLALVLWNDEAHSFSEVIGQVQDALNVVSDDARMVAETVDFHGRQVLKVSPDVVELLRIARIISRIGLTVSMRSARETFREEVAGILIDWLRDVTKLLVGAQVIDGVRYESVDGVVRQVICDELFSPPRKFKRVLSQRLVDNPGAELSGTIRQADISQLPVDESAERETKLRVDHMILSDIKMWKQARNALRGLFVKTMIVGGEESKKRMASRFGHSYLQIITNFLLHDREPELSVVSFSVQLFTVPSIGNYLATKTNLLLTMFSVMKAFYLSEVLPERFPLKNFSLATRNAQEWVCDRYPKLTCDSEAAKSKRYWQLFQEFRYLLMAHRHVGGTESAFAESKGTLDAFLDLLRVWQSMHPQTRYTRQHIEYEQENWIQAFNLSLQLGKLLAMVAECIQSKTESGNLCHEAIKTITVLDAWTAAEEKEEVAKVLKQQGHAAGVGVNMNLRVPHEDGFHTVEFIEGKPVRVPFFNVASQAVSFHHPLQWFLAYQIGSMLDAPWDFPNGRTILEHIFAGSSQQGADTKLVCRMMEGPLQTTVLLSQIRAGAWVRNGLTPRAQVTHYRSTIREHYDQDLFLLQAYLCLVGPDLWLNALLDRYDLAQWFKGDPRACALLSGLEDAQVGFLAEDFLELLITLFGERSRINGLSPSLELRREIVHYLAVGGPYGITYSDLSSRLLERLVSSAQDVDQILEIVADFKYPEGTHDSGVYLLKNECWTEVDPWFWHYDKNQREQVEVHLKEKYKNHPATWWVPKPPPIHNTATGFSRLDLMVQSEVFIHIAFFAIWNTFFGLVQSTFVVNEAVHILALALATEKQVDGSDSGVYAFSGLVDQVAIAVPGSTKRLTLLQLLLAVLDREHDDDDLKEPLRRIDWIVEQLGERGGANAAATLRTWKAGGGAKAEKSVAKAEVNVQKRLDAKAAAAARKAAIMAEFAQAQKKFSEENPFDVSDTEDGAPNHGNGASGQGEGWDIDDENVDAAMEIIDTSGGAEERTQLWEFPSGTCIFCQEETTDGTETYGILGFAQPSTVLRSAEVGHELVPSYLRADEEIGLYMSSCGHFMHLTCFHSYYASIRTRHETQDDRSQPENIDRNEFLCPLCKTLGNCFIPVLWTAKEERVVPIREPATVEEWWSTGLGDFATALIHGELGEEQGEMHEKFSSAVTSHRRRDPPGGSPAGQGPSILYRRLTRTLIAALGPKPHDLHIEGMIEMRHAISYTVRCLEVIARDRSVEGSEAPITDHIPANSLTLLRVMSEGLLTCAAADLRNNSESETRLEERGQELVWSIFAGVMDGEVETVPLMPFLMMDGIDALGEVLYGVEVMKGGAASFWEWTSVFYVREIVAALVNVVEAVGFRGMEIDAERGKGQVDDEWSAFFCDLGSLLNLEPGVIESVLARTGVAHLKWIVDTCVLGFMRQCVLLGWARAGLVLDAAGLPPGTLEAERLRRQLRLPTVDEICNSRTLRSESFLRRLIEGWCLQLHDLDPAYWACKGHPSLPRLAPDGSVTTTPVDSAAATAADRYVVPNSPLYVATCTVRVPRLIALPHRLEKLFEDSIRKVCKRCRTIPTDPALCLICGTFVCSQSYCCQEEDKGECHIHAGTCGGEVGIYFIVKKCVIYLMHNENGCFIHPPYLDAHGEVDVGLRRGRPQFLNHKRYDELNRTWLMHGIPSFVARKIESTYDVGGWMTL
ncbi:hypothetical protein HDU89_008730 [Geranomyces variabilis]|nr:hypothetical protein HDU89_008730 [Geranomyces variabilis]